VANNRDLEALVPAGVAVRFLSAAAQSRLAQIELEKAELVAITLPALCELVWVLAQGYRISAQDIADVLRRLIDSGNVSAIRPDRARWARSAPRSENAGRFHARQWALRIRSDHARDNGSG
jgi:predicted nucleic-acid-binding protein